MATYLAAQASDLRTEYNQLVQWAKTHYEVSEHRFNLAETQAAHLLRAMQGSENLTEELRGTSNHHEIECFAMYTAGKGEARTHIEQRRKLNVVPNYKPINQY